MRAIRTYLVRKCNPKAGMMWGYYSFLMFLWLSLAGCTGVENIPHDETVQIHTVSEAISDESRTATESETGTVAEEMIQELSQSGNPLERFAALVPETDIYVNWSRVADINGDGMPELCFGGASGWDYRVYYYLNGEVHSVENMEPWTWSSSLYYTGDGTLVLFAESHTTGTAGILQHRIYQWTEDGYFLAEDLWRMPAESDEKGTPIRFEYISSQSCIDPFTEDYSGLLISQSEYEQKIEQMGALTRVAPYGSYGQTYEPRMVMDWDEYFDGPMGEKNVEEIMEYVKEEIRNWEDD